MTRVCLQVRYEIVDLLNLKEIVVEHTKFIVDDGRMDWLTDSFLKEPVFYLLI